MSKLILKAFLGSLCVFTLVGYIYLSNDVKKQQQAYIEVLEGNVEYLENRLSYRTTNDVFFEICSLNNFKSYMPYQAITYRNSKQWKLQQVAYTEEKFGLRMIGEYVMVAMSSNYGDIGTKLEIGFSDGSVILAIIGDFKDAGHDGCKSLRDGSMLEFIIDNDKLPDFLRFSGDFNNLYNGSITFIKYIGYLERVDYANYKKRFI